MGKHVQAVIVGCGFSGLASAITMKDHFKTTDFVIYDRQERPGGTWAANTYPGCASDVPAPWYSLSTDLKPNWSQMQPPQPEMQSYLAQVVENHGLEENLKLQHAVSKLDWDEENQHWQVTATNVQTNETFTHTAKLAFVCQGFLVQPNHFDMPGLKDGTFQGDYMHSATWDHTVDMKDKNIVVIGNGCSASQIIPNIIGDSKQLTQIIRSPHWFVEGHRPGAYDLYKKTASWGDTGMRLYRAMIFLLSEMRAPLFNTENWLSSYVSKKQENISTEYMKSMIPEHLYSITLPDFKFGCKRMINDQGYLKTLSDERMVLKKENISHLTEQEIHTKEGNSYPCDVLIAATGYDTKKSVTGMPIYGTDKSETLAQRWNRDGIRAYNTNMVDGYPNMFFVAGPNSATGHSSVVFAIENTMTYVKQVVAPVLNGNKESVAVTTNAFKTWDETLRETLPKTVFSSPLGGCVSWYAKDGGPASNYLTYPFSQITNWFNMAFPTWSDLSYVSLDKKDI